MTDPAYVRHKNLVRMVILRHYMPLLQRGFDFDDMMQEGMLEIWRAEAGYRPELGTEATYYARCAYNGIKKRCSVLLSAQKRHAEQRPLSLDAPAAGLSADAGGDRLMDTLAAPGDIAERIADRDAVRRYLAALAERAPLEADAIRRRYLDGAKPSEIARERGVRQQAVSCAVIKGLKALRSIAQKDAADKPAQYA